MNDETDNADTSNARVGGPLSPAERERKQKRFLSVYRKTANIKRSCAYAGIHRSTFYDWRDHDDAFKAQLPDAEADANDTLEGAVHDRAVNGVPSYVVSQGKLVYGPNKKPLIELKYSDSLAVVLLKARMPEKYKDKQSVEVSGAVDVAGFKELLMQRLARLEENG